MAAKFLSFHLMIMILCLSYTPSPCYSRPLKVQKNTIINGQTLEGAIKGLPVRSITRSGPNPGIGHQHFDVQTLGGIKNSGPSPGGGNNQPNIHTLKRNEVYVSNTLPVNKSNGQFNVQALGAIKDSGPSPGGGNHHSDIETLGGIKDSGPSPGQGNNLVTAMHN